MLKRHAIQVLRRAGHTLDEIAVLTAVGKRSVQRVSAEPMIAEAVVAPGARSIGRPSKAAAYRTQLFCYLKSCGREELGTANLWRGVDPTPAQ